MARAVVVVKRPTKIDTIEIDSCLDESHSLTNTVTDHPVEEGFNVTDHSRPNADVVTLRCFVSNTPLSIEQQTRSVREGSVDFETTAADATEIGAVDGRGDKAFKALEKLRLEGAIIQIVTSLKTYEKTQTEGMMISSITIPRTRQNFDGLEFSISLKQIRIVKNKSTTDIRARDKRTRPKKKDGQKPVFFGPEPQKVTPAKQYYRVLGGTR